MTRSKNGENSGDNNGRTPVAQAHGGALLPGGEPGNAGGTGRPPNEVRATARMAFDERIPLLGEIADDKSANPASCLSGLVERVLQ